MSDHDVKIIQALRKIFHKPNEYPDGRIEDYQINGGDLVEWLDYQLSHPHSAPHEDAVCMGLITQ